MSSKTLYIYWFSWARSILEFKNTAKQNPESKTQNAGSNRMQKAEESNLNPELRKQSSESRIQQNVEHIRYQLKHLKSKKCCLGSTLGL